MDQPRRDRRRQHPISDFSARGRPIRSRVSVRHVRHQCQRQRSDGFPARPALGSLGNSAATRALLATGFLGAYTTFSTFTWETALFRERETGPAMVNVLGSALLGIGGALAGIWLGQQTGGWW